MWVSWEIPIFLWGIWSTFKTPLWFSFVNIEFKDEKPRQYRETSYLEGSDMSNWFQSSDGRYLHLGMAKVSKGCTSFRSACRWTPGYTRTFGVDVYFHQSCKRIKSHFSYTFMKISLVGARSVDTRAFILANRRGGSTFICVIKAARTGVTRETWTRVASTRHRAACSSVGAGTWQTPVLVFTASSWNNNKKKKKKQH